MQAPDPTAWREWKERDWNHCLLRYCFLLDGENEARLGIPSSEEDLPFALGTPELSSQELVEAFLEAITTAANWQDLRPAKLFARRADKWDPDSSVEPPFFAFLWATCLISQGYPNPYESGEFHMRYERVFGREPKLTFQALKLGWSKLVQWLERDDILDGQEHRTVSLPTELGKRKNIGYSWHLSFPSRRDRTELAGVIEQLLAEGVSIDPVTATVLHAIRQTGHFSAGFADELKAQHRKASTSGSADDWFAAMIRHEYNQLITAPVTSAGTRRSSRRQDLGLALVIDLEDPSQIELCLPAQEISGLEPLHHTASFSTLDPVGSEHRWSPSKGLAWIDSDVRQTVIQPEPSWTWKLRSGSSQGATLQRWSCPGVDAEKPILCFCPESGRRLLTEPIISDSDELWFFAPKQFQLEPNEAIEECDELRWGVSLKGWRGYLLRLTQPSTLLELHSEGNPSMSVQWVLDAGRRPLLRGNLVDKQKGIYTAAPTLWIPPLSHPVSLSLDIKDQVTGEGLSDTEAAVDLEASDQWTEIDISECLESGERFSIVIKPLTSCELPARWRASFRVMQQAQAPAEPGHEPPSLTTLEAGHTRLQRLDNSLIANHFADATDYWLAQWIVEGLWPLEPIELMLSNGDSSITDQLSADAKGRLEISMGVYRYALPGDGKQGSISLRRQGEQAGRCIASTGELRPAVAATEPTANEPQAAAAAPRRTTKGRSTDFIVTFRPRLTYKEGKRQIETFIKTMKSVIEEAGIPADELFPQGLEPDVWIRVINRQHIQRLDELLKVAEQECGFQIIKQRRR